MVPATTLCIQVGEQLTERLEEYSLRNTQMVFHNIHISFSWLFLLGKGSFKDRGVHKDKRGRHVRNLNIKLPLARIISRSLHQSKNEDGKTKTCQRTSHMLMSFGQLLDHDTVLTPEAGAFKIYYDCNNWLWIVRDKMLQETFFCEQRSLWEYNHTKIKQRNWQNL